MYACVVPLHCFSPGRLVLASQAVEVHHGAVCLMDVTPQGLALPVPILALCASEFPRLSRALRLFSPHRKDLPMQTQRTNGLAHIPPCASTSKLLYTISVPKWSLPVTPWIASRPVGFTIYYHVRSGLLHYWLFSSEFHYWSLGACLDLAP